MGVRDLDAILADANTNFLDSMVFIYLLEQNSKYVDLAALMRYRNVPTTSHHQFSTSKQRCPLCG